MAISASASNKWCRGLGACVTGGCAGTRLAFSGLNFQGFGLVSGRANECGWACQTCSGALITGGGQTVKGSTTIREVGLQNGDTLHATVGKECADAKSWYAKALRRFPYRPGVWT